MFGAPLGETGDPDESILGLSALCYDDEKKGLPLSDLLQDQGGNLHYHFCHFCSNYHHRSTLTSDNTVESKICLKLSYLLHVALSLYLPT